MYRDLVFKKNHGRARFLIKVASYPVRVFLKMMSARFIKNGYKQVAVFGFDYIGNQISVAGIFEKDELETLFSWLFFINVDLSKTIALDVGANIGNHSLFFADYFKSVVGFEPNPRTFQLLKFNTELSGNIQCLNIGLSDSEETLMLYCPLGNAGQASLIKPNAVGLKEYVVDVKTLDSLGLSEKIGLMKIDVEGYELKVLQGAEKTIRENLPFIVFEQQADGVRDGSSSTVEFLKSLNYSKFVYVAHQEDFLPKFVQVLIMPFVRLLFGEKTIVRQVPRLKKSFYSMIVAIPPWCRADERGYEGQGVNR